MKKTITLSIATFALAVSVFAQVPRKVLVEDFTGEWCGWCPLGRTAAEHLEATFPGQVVQMGQHYNDPLACTYSVNLSAWDSYGFPGFMIDRTRFASHLWAGVGYSGTDLDSRVQQELSTTSPVGVGITSTYDVNTRVLNVTVTATFEAAASGTMRISCVLTEDSVSTPGVQHNYMNTDNSSPWYGVGDPITTYIQRDVTRRALSGTWGDANSIPTSVTQGSTYSKSYTYTIPSTWNPSKMSIVGFVSHYATVINSSSPDTTQVDVMNANDARFGTTVSGIEESNNNISLNSIYPNPSAGEVFIPLTLTKAGNVTVKIYDITGRCVTTLQNGMLGEGSHLLRWNAAEQSGEEVSNGIYFCEISSGETNIAKRIVISR